MPERDENVRAAARQVDRPESPLFFFSNRVTIVNAGKAIRRVPCGRSPLKGRPAGKASATVASRRARRAAPRARPSMIHRNLKVTTDVVGTCLILSIDSIV
jgi:hypothetical protein